MEESAIQPSDRVFANIYNLFLIVTTVLIHFGCNGPWTWVHPASNWTHWATLRRHPCLSRAPTSASSQVIAIFYKSVDCAPLVRSWSTLFSLIFWYLPVQCLLWYVAVMLYVMRSLSLAIQFFLGNWGRDFFGDNSSWCS